MHVPLLLFAIALTTPSESKFLDADLNTLSKLLEKEEVAYNRHDSAQSVEEYNPYVPNQEDISKITNLYLRVQKFEPWPLAITKSIELHKTVDSVIVRQFMDGEISNDRPKQMLAQCLAGVRARELTLDRYQKFGVFKMVFSTCWAKVYAERFGKNEYIEGLYERGESLHRDLYRISKELSDRKCAGAYQSRKNVYQSCWGRDQTSVSLRMIVALPETVNLLNSADSVRRTNYVRELLISIFNPKFAPIDPGVLQFAVDLYHTLPPGVEPPPSDITPTVTDKGLLWRFDEPLGEWSYGCKSNQGLPQNSAPICKYFFVLGNIDSYEKPARSRRVKFPSPNETKLRAFLAEHK